jgi:parallel beta-helix repeat protein
MHKTGTHLAALFTLILLTTLATEYADLTKANFLTPEVVPVEHAYIRSNGEVDPPTAPIQRTGNLYTMTDDLLNCSIQIEKDNVMIDGNGFSLGLPSDVGTGLAGLSYGKTGDALVEISNRKNVVAINVTSSNYFTGISVKNSSGVIILGNNFSNGRLGIYVYESTNCSIIGNKLTNNSNTGLFTAFSSFLNITFNTLSKNLNHGAQIVEVAYSNITRNDITSNYLGSSPGIGLDLTGANHNNTIFGNNLIDNDIGLSYTGNPGLSKNNTVYNNYWNNYNEQIHGYAADRLSGIDQSPLSQPITGRFNPSDFPLPAFESTDEPQEEKAQTFLPSPLVIILIALGAILVISLLAHTKKRSSKCNTSPLRQA